MGRFAPIAVQWQATPPGAFPESDPVSRLIGTFHHFNASIFPGDFFFEIGGVTEEITLYDEIEFHLRFALMGGRLVGLPENLAVRVKHPSSTMHRTPWEKHNADLLFIARKLDPLFRGQPGAVTHQWRRYLESKLRMTFFLSGCTAHFREVLPFIARPEEPLHRILCKTIGYIPYLRLLKAYSRWRLPPTATPGSACRSFRCV